jgi:hypothetical protein
MRSLALIVILLTTVGRAAELQFVGVMMDSKHTIFAVRDGKSSRASWVSIGDSVGGFVVVSYDSKAEALTMRKGAERVVLTLPDGQVRMGPDEVVAGLQAVLNVPGAERISDFLHPKLKPLFKPEDFVTASFRDILAPGTKLEIRGIPEAYAKALESGLSEVENVVGVRPTHGLWISRSQGFSMSFVVKSGESWYLAPSVPKAQEPMKDERPK